ncbi:hypothetical protein BC830DRAFT_893038 [Chytriomyces sp. MP71]|nr:hypothetical protein BC830DRAFT_893038 [Chytriomyces sp. MP71]
MALHLATIHKSMPVENVQLSPFTDAPPQPPSAASIRKTLSAKTPPSSTSLSRSQPITRVGTRGLSVDRGSSYATAALGAPVPHLEAERAVQYLQAQQLWPGEQMQADVRRVEGEVDYIRGGYAGLSSWSTGGGVGGSRGFAGTLDEVDYAPVVGDASGVREDTRRVASAMRTSRKFFVLDLVEDVERHKNLPKQPKVHWPRQAKKEARKVTIQKAKVEENPDECQDSVIIDDGEGDFMQSDYFE